MKRLTEPCGRCFRLIGSKTVYPSDPPKSQKIGTALAKLFRMEEMVADYDQHREFCSRCDTEFPVPDHMNYRFCPICGNPRTMKGEL